MASPQFMTAFDPCYGQPVDVAPQVVRITAPNGGPMTFHGTNSYLIGNQTLALVDPGPNDDAHFDTLIAAIGGRPVSHILITHTHLDHTALLDRIQKKTGALVVGAAPHRAARPIALGEINHLDAAADHAYRPDQALSHGQKIDIDGIKIEAIATPGHTANHLCFAVGDDGVVLTGDHIMSWATTIVAPPDGSMRSYLASLDLMAKRGDALYLPGHGGQLNNPASFVRALKSHRRMRERAILERLSLGDRRIADVVKAIYKDTDPRLHGAAALSVMAQMEYLVERQLVICDGPLSLQAVYEPAAPISSKSNSD